MPPLRADVLTFEMARGGDSQLLLAALHRYVQAILTLRQVEQAANAASKARVEGWLTGHVDVDTSDDGDDRDDGGGVDDAKCAGAHTSELPARTRSASSGSSSGLKRRPGQLMLPGEGPVGEQALDAAAPDATALAVSEGLLTEGLLTPERGQCLPSPISLTYAGQLTGRVSGLPELAVAMRAAALATENHSPRTAALKLRHFDRVCSLNGSAASRMRQQRLRQDETAVLSRAEAEAELAQAATAAEGVTPSRIHARLQALEWRNRQEVPPHRGTGSECATN